jgi:hypothetical protein
MTPSWVYGSRYARGLGSVFVPSDFLHLGSRQAIDVVLHRLTRKGIIRRLARGLYDFRQKRIHGRTLLMFIGFY